jgi:ArsR family transcriptional regulator
MGNKDKNINPEICEIKTINKEVVERVAQDLPSSEEMQTVSNFFKLFSDQSRLAIIWALSEAEMCVCDICATLGMKQSAVSHQLNKLKLLRVAKSRREGKVVYYSLDDSHVKTILSMGFEHNIVEI